MLFRSGCGCRDGYQSPCQPVRHVQTIVSLLHFAEVTDDEYIRENMAALERAALTQESLADIENL